MDYRKKLIVEPGSKPKLKHVDPGWSRQARQRGRRRRRDRQGPSPASPSSQELLYGERKHALLIVLQGIDAAGKDGTCWHVIDGDEPAGHHRHRRSSSRPPEDLAHDFLWRVHPHAPGLGQVAVFNRSHYEDVLVVRVHKLVPKAVWSKRYDQINEFETPARRRAA